MIIIYNNVDDDNYRHKDMYGCIKKVQIAYAYKYR